MYSCTEGARATQISGGRGGLASESMQTIRPHAVCHDKPLLYGPERLQVGFPDIIMKTKFGFDLAPSNIDLAGAEIELKQLLASEQVLKRKLEEILDDYDYVLLDCPPSLGML